MRRPVGVTVAASILGLIALFGLLVVAFSFAGTFLMHNPALHNPALHEAAGTRAAMAGIDFFFACAFAFCLWTVVGLFRLRRWARYSVIVIGILIFIICGLISALMLVVRHFVMSPHFAHGAKAAVSPAQLSIVSIVLIAIGVIYAVIALIGVWWAVYFNRKHVRLAFAAGGAAVPGSEIPAANLYGPWHGVVTAFACLMLAGVVFLLAMAWLRLPFVLLGMILHGNSARAVALVFAAIQLFVGIGLLRRLRPAYWTAVAWQVFGVLSAALMLVPSYAARVLALGNEETRRFMPPFPTNSAFDSRQMLSLQQHFFLLAVIPSVVIFLILLYALWRCRHWYLDESPVASPV